MAADAELMALRAEEADIQARLGAVSLEDHPESQPEASPSAANDADNDRLAAIYDRLAVRACPCLSFSDNADACCAWYPVRSAGIGWDETPIKQGCISWSCKPKQQVSSLALG